MMRVKEKRDMTTIQLIGIVSLFISFILSILKYITFFYSVRSVFFQTNLSVFFLAVGLLMFYWDKRNSRVLLFIAVIASLPVMFPEESNQYFIIESITFSILIINTIIIVKSYLKYFIIISYLYLIFANITAVNTFMMEPWYFLLRLFPFYGAHIHYLIQPVAIIFFITIILTNNRNKSDLVHNTNDEQINLGINNCRNCGASISNNVRICYSCGFDPLDGSHYCQNCGSKTVERQIVCLNCNAKLGSITKNKYYLNNNELDQNNKELNIISFILPIIGLVLYIIYHQNYPIKSKGIVKWSFIGLILGVFFSSLYYFFIISSFY